MVWPYSKGRGKHRLIVCGDLARAVRQESELAVAYWGALLDINAFDQPAVAFGKQAAIARLLGTPAALVAEMDAARAKPRRLARLGE